MHCVHCLKEAGTTKDHVFPKSWYPDNTPETIQRPTVPACPDCNGKLGAIERSLFQKLAVCIDPRKAEASGIHKSAFRSFGIGVDENQMSERDRRARRASLEKIMSSVRPYKSTFMKAFPGLGPHKGYEPDSQVAFPAPVEEMISVSQKIIRGMEYWVDKHYIEPPLYAKAYFIEDESLIPEVQAIFNRWGEGTQYGPGFSVTRAKASDGLFRGVIYRFVIWGTLTVYGSVMPEETEF